MQSVVITYDPTIPVEYIYRVKKQRNTIENMNIIFSIFNGNHVIVPYIINNDK